MFGAPVRLFLVGVVSCFWFPDRAPWSPWSGGEHYGMLAAPRGSGRGGGRPDR